MIEFIETWKTKTALPYQLFLNWVGLAKSKYYEWKRRAGRENQHNGQIPRSHWLLEQERQAIVAYSREHPREGYRRLTFMMLDEDVAAVSPSSVYRALVEAGLLNRWARGQTSKGEGFEQPERPHEHWHIDISYLNINGTFYYLCSILDGYSRYIVSWDIREAMKEGDVELIIQRGLEAFPGETPRIISDNGPQFISKDFKVYIRMMGMTHVKTSPYYPQSNGKKERYFKTLKSECIRVQTPLSREDALRVVSVYVEEYNQKRLHSAIGYITPHAKLHGEEERIFAERKEKLRRALEHRVQVFKQQPNESASLPG